MYKYCIVPKCTNTTIKTPEKLFFNVPKDPELRKNWYSIAKRDDKVPPSAQATRHCCEDHFDLEEDMENYLKFKLLRGNLKLKKGVLPHKFECHKPQKKKIDRPGFKTRQDIEHFERVLSKDIGHKDRLLHSIEVVKCENQDSNITQNIDTLNIPEEPYTPSGTSVQDSSPPFRIMRIPEGIDILSKNNERSQNTQAVQVNMKPKMKTISTNTPITWKQCII